MPATVIGLDPVDVTAWATIALAAVGAISIVTGIALAVGTFRAANAARDASVLQRQQIDLLDRELKLVEQQANDAREIAWPKLRVSTFTANLETQGVILHYVQGTLPATDIQMVVRQKTARETGWGLFVGWSGYMSSGEKWTTALTKATAQQQDSSPFPEFLGEDPAPDELFVGLVWKSPDGREHRLTQRQFLGGKPVEPFTREKP
jgi:hypothetical protein